MNDILPPKPPKRPLGEPPRVPQPPQQPATSTPVVDLPPVVEPQEKKRGINRKAVWITLGGILGLPIIGVLLGFLWYQNALRPVSPDDTTRMRIQIVEGSSPSQIGQLLEEKKLIQSGFAFEIFTRLTGTRSKLQAGTYHLSPSESTGQIVDHMVLGRIDEFNLTFYPGATLTDKTDTPENKKTDVQTVLLRAGYSQEEIDTAFAKEYDHPLFATKPASADLEGYVYGETYSFASDATVEQILERTFDEYYAVIQENNLIEAFKKQGLTLFEGITMASIVQREVPGAEDQKQVAQVFLKRYNDGMELGSDITAYYGADKIGAKRSVAVDTPYNTRIHTGLPPGPIASPGKSALIAVAHPAPGDYVYFLSGDDDITYFARTFEQHEENIRDHCKIKCAME